MEEITHTKICPKCASEQKFKSFEGLRIALRDNTSCMKCRRNHWLGKKHSEDTKGKMSKVHSGRKMTNPRKLSDKEKDDIKKRMIGNTYGKGVKHTEEHKAFMSISQKGRVFSEETKRKMSESMKGRKHSAEVQERINRNIKRGDDHPNKRPENREKLRLAYLEKKRKNTNGKLVAFYNKSACIIFNEINNYFGWDGLHAENKGEYPIKGWWLDYYEPTQNIVIEYDEAYHKTRVIKDEIKQDEVTKALGCRYFRIKEGDDWRNVFLNSNFKLSAL